MKRLIAAALAATLTIQILFPIICRSSEDKPATMPSAPFEPELYSLGYDVFLANSNPEAAFSLAEKALTVRPDDSGWRRRAAQSGEWSGHGLRALDHWLYLSEQNNQQDATEHALRIARGLRLFSKMKPLLEKRNLTENFSLAVEYVAVCEALGFPESAVTVMGHHRKGPHKKEALVQLARLYEALGKPREAVYALMEQQIEFGITTDEILRAASLTYGTGDVKRSYAILALGRQSVPATDKEYWQNMSDLAWSMQDMSAAEQASQLLVSTGNGREDDYHRLILIKRDKDPEMAFQLSLEGWEYFGMPDFLKSVLELGISLQKYRMLADLLLSTEKNGSLKGMEQNSYFWSLASQVQRGIGAVDESIRCYRKALQRAPKDGELAAGFVWLLLDLDRRKDLLDLMHSWQGREKIMTALQTPFAATCSYLGLYPQALFFFQAGYAANSNNPGWLAAYAEILEHLGRQEAAFSERVRAVRLTYTHLKSFSAESDADRQALLRDYVRLAMLLTPGDPLDSEIRKIIRAADDDGSRELVAVWALSRQCSDLARLWLWKKYNGLTRRPHWIELALALEVNDHEKIAQLLSHDLARIPYRDAIEAAQRIGWIPFAETLAFDQLQINDRDTLLDQQVRELYSSGRGGFRYNVSILDQGGVGFFKQQIRATTAMSQRLSLLMGAENSEIRHLKPEVIGYYPSRIVSAYLGVSFRSEKGSTEIFGGLRDALYQHPIGGLKSEWKQDHRLTLEMTLLVGAESSETVGMKIGGMKDEIRLGMLQKLTVRDTAGFQLSGRTLRDQERNHLADGAAIDAELSHWFLFANPGTVLRLFGGYHYYTQCDIPVDKAYQLIPEVQKAHLATSYFIPPSFSLAGFGILVGQEEKENYPRTWRPVAALDTNWNSSSGIGYHYEVGLVGPVLGIDQLEWTFSQDRGAFAAQSTTSRLDFRYRYYFR